MNVRIAIVSIVLAVPVLAQTVTLTATAITPIVARTNTGAQPQVVTWLPGALPAWGNVWCNQGSGAPTARFFWEESVSDYGAYFRWQNSATVNTTAPGASAETDLADVLLTVSASSPLRVGFVIQRETTASAGAATPTSRIDIDNDGSFEVDESTPLVWGTPWQSQTLTLGPQPRQILVRTRMSMLGTGSLSSFGEFGVVPRNDLTITKVVQGCFYNSFSSDLQVLPTFSSNGFAIPKPFWMLDPLVGVIGLGLQPLVLPSSFPACLLLPSPDLIALLPAGPTAFTLPVPAAVRPVTLYAQAVVVPAVISNWGPMATMNGFSIVAQ